MLATQMPDTPPDTKDVKQIKDKLVQSLKALQKRYVTSDAVVTSEDADANILCCALEAIFIHGIKSKFVRTENGRKKEKGLPQPVFWSLLKTVTHRDVITELEKLNFVNTDVGRCRAWLRLALNHGLVECYLASLFREESKLQAHYQSSAILLNPEEREVLLSYLQGLSSLTFSLSYKSAVLKEWTTTPLALAGLCPMSQVDALEVSVNGRDAATKTTFNEWDTVSQSSGSSDTVDMIKWCPVIQGGQAQSQNTRTALTSSNLSLDTAGSSQLSSSLSSDSLLQGQDPRSTPAEQSSSSDLDLPDNGNICTKRPSKSSLSKCGESQDICSQDSMREDSFVSSTGPDQFSENAIFSCSDSETLESLSQDQTNQQTNLAMSESVPSSPERPLDKENHVSNSSIEIFINKDPERHLDTDTQSTLNEPVAEVKYCDDQEKLEPVRKEERSEAGDKSFSETFVNQDSQRSASILNRKNSESLTHSSSWISDDDIYKPQLEEVSDLDETEALVVSAQAQEHSAPQSPPSVVRRRQTGISNPFRGLLKLGHLERRGAMGMWRDYYCELSPFEFRLYLNAEERTCYDNCSLVRCEDAHLTSLDGRFELAFPGKRLYLRAANRDEAEDWLDRIVEAVNEFRPASRVDDQWEVVSENVESSVPSSPDQGFSSTDSGISVGQEIPPPKVFDWTRTCELETDAIKESVLYFSTDPEARTWVPLVFSLSLEALKGFQVEEGRKLVRLTHPIQDIRDVVPDVSLGGPAFFKVLTVRETLRLRSENAKEARSWRDLIRRALDSYLESGEDLIAEEPIVAASGINGNIQRLVQHRLKGDGTLLSHLFSVPSEKGLDSQNFKCAGCPQQIGPSLGRARLCEFTGQYYCDSCHHGDTTIIPSRMVHNWDLEQREVSKKALRLLAEVQHEPLLNIEQLNPELVKHAKSMAQVYKMRQKLSLLGQYVLTCRSSAWKKLQARMGQRSYLLESRQLYSIMDLRQIAEGHYTMFLITLVQHASNHIFQCDLCTQRGFICQTCHSNEILFPFQFETTTRCEDCKAVFHLDCKAPGHPCPRCLRIKKYQERDLED